MSRAWRISTHWPVDAGTPTLQIDARGLCLTEGRDASCDRLVAAPPVDAGALAAWMLQHWWRLRWEPHVAGPDWESAHRMLRIGGGERWPDVSICTDGVRTAFIARPLPRGGELQFRYIADGAAVVPAAEFEAEVDAFIADVVQHQGSAALAAAWGALNDARNEPELTDLRRLEALMGMAPGTLGEDAATALLLDTECFGDSAIFELAADYGFARDPAVLAVAELQAAAESELGFEAHAISAVRLRTALPAADAALHSRTPAWEVGAALARALRTQERLGVLPLNNAQLADLAGVHRASLHRNQATHFGMSFLLHLDGPQGRVVLRSKWETGRRFELARLICERLTTTDGDRLLPATRAYSYRQNMQRSFAAELLCPALAVQEMLGRDESQERLIDAAHHFHVSELMVRLQCKTLHTTDHDAFEAELMSAPDA